MSALARSMSINASTVSRWEEGDSSPDAYGLTKLAEELGVRQEFFLRPMPNDNSPVFFRSLSSALRRDRDYQVAQLKWLLEISDILQCYVDFPALDLPDVLGKFSYKQLRNDDLERIALDLRKHWGLGEGPCLDVVALMERVGFVVASIEMDTAKLDGLCTWAHDGRPHVLLANDKMSFPRRQMDAAHEMAHALLHKNVTQEELAKDLEFIETQAFRLASAFLLPSTTYPISVRTPSLASLVTQKDSWRVSIKAQIKRLADLHVIPSDYATHLYKLYSAKGWSKEEPLDQLWALQEPRALGDAINLIVEQGGRTKADLLAVEFTMSAGDIENLCSLPPGWFANDPAEVVTLKRRVGHDDDGSEGPAIPAGPSQVLQFRQRVR